jgi:signal transduction histidine kinase
MIPLMVRSHRIGLVVLSHPGVHAWAEELLRPYRATAAQLAIAIDHRLQQHLLKERGQQVAVLEERQRLARELHDSVTQLIFSTTLIAQSIGTAWRRDPREGERRVERLLELSQTALREMRALLFELRPAEEPHNKELPGTLTGPERIRHYGLPGALRLLAQDFSHDGIESRVELEETGVRVFESGFSARMKNDPPMVESLYRIAQEALNNAAKHARARHVEVSLRMHELDSICFSIRDDGIGFPADAHGNGLGMKTMRERAESLGGTLRIETAPGAGTTVEVLIPLKESRA